MFCSCNFKTNVREEAKSRGPCSIQNPGHRLHVQKQALTESRLTCLQRLSPGHLPSHPAGLCHATCPHVHLQAQLQNHAL